MIDVTSPMKKCCKCEEEHPRSSKFFFAKQASPDGLRARCKKCSKKPDKKRPKPREGYRYCTACEYEFPATLDYFAKSGRVKIGLDSKCKECRNTQQRAYLDQDPERWRQHQHDWRYQHYEHCLQRERTYRERNRDRLHLNQRRCWERNKERWLLKSKKQRRKKSEERMRLDPRTPFIEQGLRWCPKGEHWLPATYEYFSLGKRKSGFSSYCIVCHREYVKEKKYHQTEEYKQRERNYRQKNREHIYDVHRRWVERNRVRARLHNHNWRARKKGAEGTYTEEDEKRMYKAQRGRCYYCRRVLPKIYSVDHSVPLIRGGSNDPRSNLVIACIPCNSRKRHRLPHEWPEGGRLL